MRRFLMLGLVLVAAAAKASVAQETGGVPLSPEAARGPVGLARPLPVVLPGAPAADLQRMISVSNGQARPQGAITGFALPPSGLGLPLPPIHVIGGRNPAGGPNTQSDLTQSDPQKDAGTEGTEQEFRILHPGETQGAPGQQTSISRATSPPSVSTSRGQ
jgi:hypothetical protein